MEVRAISVLDCSLFPSICFSYSSRSFAHLTKCFTETARKGRASTLVIKVCLNDCLSKQTFDMLTGSTASASQLVAQPSNYCGN